MASVRNLHQIYTNAKALFSRGEKGSAQCPTALLFDPEAMQGSPAGTTAATAGGRPITTGRRSSTRKAMPDQYAMNCAAFARAMPRSSTSKQGRTTLRPTRHRRCSRPGSSARRAGYRHPLPAEEGPASHLRASSRLFRWSRPARVIRTDNRPTAACWRGWTSALMSAAAPAG